MKAICSATSRVERPSEWTTANILARLLQSASGDENTDVMARLLCAAASAVVVVAAATTVTDRFAAAAQRAAPRSMIGNEACRPCQHHERPNGSVNHRFGEGILFTAPQNRLVTGSRRVDTWAAVRRLVIAAR